jgi:outer membrane protein G
MNTLFTFILALASTAIFAQAYTGQGDTKFQVGANIQAEGTGINVTYDAGVGENISFGVSSIYLLGVTDFPEELLIEEAEFLDRFDLRARFNANLSNVLNIDENFDLYPGLNLGLKNFGGHLGARYFFTEGFGVYSEVQVPFASYKKDEDYTSEELPRKELNNQFNVSIGAVFNI